MLYGLATLVKFDLFQFNITDQEYTDMITNTCFIDGESVEQQDKDGYTIINRSGATTYYFDPKKRDEKVDHIFKNSVNSRLFKAIHAPEQANDRRIYVVSG